MIRKIHLVGGPYDGYIIAATDRERLWDHPVVTLPTAKGWLKFRRRRITGNGEQETITFEYIGKE